MSSEVPPSPGVGARRKHAPKLPLSAFSAPPSGRSTSGQFPTLPSPSSLHPSSVVDGRVAIDENPSSALEAWKADAGSQLGPKVGGVVVAVSSDSSVESVLEQLKQSPVPIVAVSLAFPLSNGAPTSPPTYLTNSPYPIALSTPVTSTISPSLIEGVKWALTAGHVVDLDVETATGAGDAGWEYVEELIGKAQTVEEGVDSKAKTTPIIISNILPPPGRLDVPIVKLLSDPGYIAYQSHTASLSLLPNTFVKLIPPDWSAPETTEVDSDGSLTETQRKEWKRRVKMYLGPAIEAFGDSRVIFGSSSTAYKTKSKSAASDWYSLARESAAELGVEQEGIDSIFEGNARLVYGQK